MQTCVGTVHYFNMTIMNNNMFPVRSSLKSSSGSRAPVFSGSLPAARIAFPPPDTDPSLGYSAENGERSGAAACIGSERYLVEHKGKCSFSNPLETRCVVLFPKDNSAS